MRRRIEVYSVKGFLSGESPKRIEGGITVRTHPLIIVTTAALAVYMFTSTASAATIPPQSAPVSTAFDSKIWPLFLDIGKPLAKTMIALGIYRCMRNDVDKGWKMVYRAGLGLVGLYLVDGGIHILTGIGDDLASA